MINIVDIGGIFLIIVFLSEGDVGVGIVGSRGRDIELGGGGKGVVLCGYDVGITVLVIPIRLCMRVGMEEQREENIQRLYSFYTDVFPKAGYPAVVLSINVATSTGEGEGEVG